MKNKLMCSFLALLIIPLIINGSGCDSPEERSIVPHLDTRQVEAGVLGAASGAISAMALIRATDLFAAARDNNLPAVTELIKSGVDVNSRGPLMMTPLSIGAYTGCQLPIIHALIEAGADVNQRGIGGTPLSNAVETGRVEHVRIFLTAKADPNVTVLGVSPLSRAVTQNQLEIARMLIAAQASVNTELLYSAIFKKNLDMVKLLVDSGVNVNDENQRCSLLGMAKRNSSPEIVDYLVSKGAVRFWGESCIIQ
ncbi:MAG: ankyrin repeat domain-containing protein [Candidatus Dependentiae bacterium]|nr:ankyrin repeat domain-containing protein [Candidatus Dependentiae bacterium]